MVRNSGEIPRGGVWSLTFGDIDSIPFDDGEAWERNNFPVAGPDGYPTFLKFGRSSGHKYPSPDELIWAEGLLRAIAETTEDGDRSGKVGKVGSDAQWPDDLSILDATAAGTNGRPYVGRSGEVHPVEPQAA